MTDIYKPDIKITDLLAQHKFTISAEIIPPRNGSPQSEILSQISKLIESGAQFLSVTKGAGGSLRAGSLPIAQVIKDHFKVPVIAHFTCRDLTPEEVENQLMDHHYFGIRNILGLRGDPPTGVKDWKPNEKSYPYAYQLIEQIQKLNQGQYLERPGFQHTGKVATQFSIGAAAYPDDPTEHMRTGYFKNKVEKGAQYGITQMLYDVDSYSCFLDELARHGVDVPILPGARILKTKSQAEKMAQRFNIPIPKDYVDSLPEQDQPEQALETFFKYTEKLKKAGAPGFHVFVLVDTELSCAAIRELRKI